MTINDIVLIGRLTIQAFLELLHLWKVVRTEYATGDNITHLVNTRQALYTNA